MPNTHLPCRERDRAHSENAPGPPPSPEPHVQPSGSADIAGLVNCLSRFQHRDSDDAEDMPLPEGGRGHRDGTQHSPAAIAGSVKPDHGIMDPALSSDEWQSPSSDEDRLEGDRFNRGKSEMIDRIMRSFCASLDSKIAVIKETKAPPTIKKEEETEPRAPILVGTKNVTTEAVHSDSLRRQSPRKRCRRDSEIQPLVGRSAATAPGAGMAQMSIISALAPVLAAAPAPAAALALAPLEPQPPRHRPTPQAPYPPPPPLPVAPSRFRDRLFPWQAAAPPPPPTPRLGRRGRDLASQPPVTAAWSGNVAQPISLSQDEEVPRAGAGQSNAGNSNILRSASRQQESITPTSHWTPAQLFPGSLAERAEQRVARTPPAANNLDLHIRRRSDVPASKKKSRRAERPNRPFAGASNSQTTPGSAEVPQEARDDEVHRRLFSSTRQQGQPDWLASGRRAEDADARDGEDGIVSTDNEAFDLSGSDSLFSDINDPRFQLDSISQAFNQTPSTASDSWACRPAIASLYGQAPAAVAQTYVPGIEPELEEAPERPQAAQKMKRGVGAEEPQLDSVQQVQQDADGDGRRKKSKRASIDVPVTGEKAGKFACPYFKRNPNKYRKWTSCPGPGWDEVHRVKTHLYRRHPLPIQCPRCWEGFKADGQLQTHLQQDPPCSVQRNRTLQEGFTKDQEKRLRSRKKTHADMTDEDKWREIYLVLFPDDDHSAIPSPYYSGSEDGGESDNPNSSGELEEYATFIRREMPTLVRRELETLFEKEFQDVEERIRPRIADIVLNLQPRLLSLYKQSQMPLSEYGPQQHDDAATGSEPTLTPLLSQGTDSGTGTGPDSTPDAVFGTDNPFLGAEAQLGFYNSGLDQHWNALNPGNHVQTQEPELGMGLGLNWDFEFDKLLNPALFMPLPGEIQTGYASQASEAQTG